MIIIANLTRVENSLEIFQDNAEQSYVIIIYRRFKGGIQKLNTYPKFF